MLILPIAVLPSGGKTGLLIFVVVFIVALVVALWVRQRRP
jgi:hypothetical protein